MNDGIPGAGAVQQMAEPAPAGSAVAGQGLGGELPADVIAALVEKRR